MAVSRIPTQMSDFIKGAGVSREMVLFIIIVIYTILGCFMSATAMVVVTMPIFFPIMIMWFGIGTGSKIALGTLSCFFPVALSVAAGMRQIDKVLIRVGQSFQANTWQMP